MLFALCFMSKLAHADFLDDARIAWLMGDLHSTIRILEPLLRTNKKVKTHKRDAARYLLGKAYTENGDLNLAARQFQLIRVGNRTLLKRSSMQEADLNLQRGQHWSVQRNCKSIRSKWPRSKEATECLLLLGESYTATKYYKMGQQHYINWLNRNRNSSRYEEGLLKQLTALQKSKPIQAKAALVDLYFNHKYPTTDRQLQQMLNEEDKRYKNLDQRTSRLWTLVRSGRYNEAWDIFTEMEREVEQYKTELTQYKLDLESYKKEAAALRSPPSEESSKAASLQKPVPPAPLMTNQELWILQHQKLVAWRTRHYDEYVILQKRIHEREPTYDTAWRLFQGYIRAGKWDEAAIIGEDALIKYRYRGKWSKNRHLVALTQMYRKDYLAAAHIWSKMRGKKAIFMTGFCYYMADKWPQAQIYFKKLHREQDGWMVAAQYWTTRGLIKQGKIEEAQEIAQWVQVHDRIGWYGILIGDLEERGAFGSNATSSDANGTWPFEKSQVNPLTPVDSWRPTRPLPPLEPTLEPPIHTYEVKSEQEQIKNPSQVPASTPYPNGYATQMLGSPKEAYAELLKLYNHSSLREAEKLILGGFYSEAAHLLSEVYESWLLRRTPYIDHEIWRGAMQYSHAHHYVMRFTNKMARQMEDPKDKQEIGRLNHPIVRAKEVWPLCEKLDVNPYLMYGIMRQESTYRDYVVSSAGAIGYIQVMPLTGAKMAYLLNEPSYSPKDLENPKINLYYGISYFAKLMERFDNAFPLAIASYNGGPHNLSRWMRQLKEDVDIDEMVEHIAFDETRIYTKKVTGHFYRYMKLYESRGINVPNPEIIADDPSVINF